MGGVGLSLDIGRGRRRFPGGDTGLRVGGAWEDGGRGGGVKDEEEEDGEDLSWARMVEKHLLGG